MERCCELIARLTGMLERFRSTVAGELRTASGLADQATFVGGDPARSGARLHLSGGFQEPYREDRPHKPYANEKKRRERLGVPGDAADG